MEMALELKVLVSMMSAPASRYCVWISSMICGWERFSASLLQAQISRVMGEFLAAVVGFVQVAGLDHGAHGAIEQQDALAHPVEQFGANLFAVIHRLLSMHPRIPLRLLHAGRGNLSDHDTKFTE